MPALNSFDYAVVRLVPSVERGEFINAGIILFCRDHRFLKAQIELATPRLLALAPDLDLPLVQVHLALIPLICAGGKAAGYIGQLSQNERFHWLVAPSSTIIQVSPAHSGLCADPTHTLEHLMNKLVRL